MSNNYDTGKLLTTPSRLLKLILPLTTRDKNSDRKDIEPLALLVHPQQPLSYLERLIQSELPMITAKDGHTEKVPEVYFRAEDSAQDEIKADSRRDDLEGEAEEGTDEQMVDGKIMKLGKINSSKDKSMSSEEKKQMQSELRGGAWRRRSRKLFGTRTGTIFRGRSEVCSLVFIDGDWRFHS